MTTFMWIAGAYILIGALITIFFGFVAHGQGENHYIFEALKMGAVWPYWVVKLIF